MERCRHQACQCEGQPAFDGYCSTHCAEADRRPRAGESRGCGCGHPPCGDTRP